MLTFDVARPGARSAPGGRSWRARALSGLVALGGALALALAVAATPVLPSAPTEHVTDPAGFLTPFTQRDLSLRLHAYEQRTGRQVLVWVGPSGGDPIEDFAARAFQAWQVGRTGQDDGLALFVFPEERRLRFEVGYGLEGTLPDAYTARILNEIAVPRLRAGNADGAVRASLDAALGLLDGRPAREVFAAAASDLGSPGTGAPGTDPRALGRAEGRPRGAQPQRPLSALEWVLLVLFGLFMLWLLFTHPALAFYLLQVLVSGGRGGGGGGGDGGFRGGGGRSGGGGASASW